MIRAGFTTVMAVQLSALGVFSVTAEAGTYPKDAMLHGAIEVTKVSGYKGTAFTLQDDNEDHAIYGMVSSERKDQPCFAMIRTENINDHADDDGGEVLDLCGGKATSSLLKVEYPDLPLYDPRIFVKGVRVCLNSKGTRVKGLQLSGRQITDDGKPIELTYNEPIDFLVGGAVPVDVFDPTQPKDQRPNCDKDQWKRWAECPRHNQIATGAILHFEAGKEPRALTGIQLQCRYVSRLYKPAQ